MDEANLPNPTFKKQTFMTIATIKNHLFNENVPQNGTHDGTHKIIDRQLNANNMDIIITAMNNNPKITRIELAKLIGKSTRTIQRMIESNPKIKYIGSGSNGHWEIISEEPNEKTIQVLQESEVISKDSSIKGYDIENALEELKK